MRVHVVCRPALADGFELAGLKVTRVGPAGAVDAVKRLAAVPDLGILLVDDELYRALPRDLVGRIDRDALPILAPVPTPAWEGPGAAEAYIMDILRQAIGYRVRPR